MNQEAPTSTSGGMFTIKKYILDIIKYEYAIAKNNKSSLSLSNEDKDMLKIILDIWDNKLKED